MSRRTLLVLLAVFMLGPVTAVAQDAPFVCDVFNRINGQRTRNRLKACTYDKELESAAQAHAEWMARQRKMEHLQPPPASFEEHRTCNHHPINRAINAGYLKRDEVFTAVQGENGMAVVTKADANDYIGEIIAAAWGGGHPASHTQTIVDGWMKSPGHRKGDPHQALQGDGNRCRLHPRRQRHLLVRVFRGSEGKMSRPSRTLDESLSARRSPPEGVVHAQRVHRMGSPSMRWDGAIPDRVKIAGEETKP